MWAITPNGAGQLVGAREIRPGDALVNDEVFTAAIWSPDMVLADDGISLRNETTAELLVIAIKAKTEMAWEEMEQRLKSAVATVNISGSNYPFGCDRESRENIIGINVAISSGIPVPDPRPWTPKGALAPIDCSHIELAAIGGGVLAVKDAYATAYFTHKATLSALTTEAAIENYDVTTGWPV